MCAMDRQSSSSIANSAPFDAGLHWLVLDEVLAWGLIAAVARAMTEMDADGADGCRWESDASSRRRRTCNSILMDANTCTVSIVCIQMRIRTLESKQECEAAVGETEVWGCLYMQP